MWGSTSPNHRQYTFMSICFTHCLILLLFSNIHFHNGWKQYNSLQHMNEICCKCMQCTVQDTKLMIMLGWYADDCLPNVTMYDWNGHSQAQYRYNVSHDALKTKGCHNANFLPLVAQNVVAVTLLIIDQHLTIIHKWFWHWGTFVRESTSHWWIYVIKSQ